MNKNKHKTLIATSLFNIWMVLLNSYVKYLYHALEQKK